MGNRRLGRSERQQWGINAWPAAEQKRTPPARPGPAPAGCVIGAVHAARHSVGGGDDHDGFLSLLCLRMTDGDQQSSRQLAASTLATPVQCGLLWLELIDVASPFLFLQRQDKYLICSISCTAPQAFNLERISISFLPSFLPSLRFLSEEPAHSPSLFPLFLLVIIILLRVFITQHKV